jgi:hypothetical protein
MSSSRSFSILATKDVSDNVKSLQSPIRTSQSLRVAQRRVHDHDFLTAVTLLIAKRHLIQGMEGLNWYGEVVEEIHAKQEVGGRDFRLHLLPRLTRWENKTCIQHTSI